MLTYSCETCKYTTLKKNNLLKHLNTKKHKCNMVVTKNTNRSLLGCFGKYSSQGNKTYRLTN